MLFALLLALASVAGATLLTYLYDREALLWSRLCAGVCVGFALLGLAGFVFASVFGMTAAALALAGALTGAPLLLLLRAESRRHLGADVGEVALAVRQSVTSPGKRRFKVWVLLSFLLAGLLGWLMFSRAVDTLFFYFFVPLLGWLVFIRAYHLLFYSLTALLFWWVFDRAMYADERGIFTGVDTNIGDLPFHLAVITGFAHGDNFPPQHPEFAGVKMTYPFVADFVSAMFVRAGATLQGALFWPNLAMMLALVGLLHRWALKLTRDRAAALMTPALVLLSGGFGWVAFLKEAAQGGQGVFQLLGNLAHDYTIMRHAGYAWGNAVTALLVPQRGILLGVALAVVVWTLWWQATEEGETGGRGDGEKEEGRQKAKGKRQKAKVTAAARRGEARGVRRKRKNEERETDAPGAGAEVASTSSSSLPLPFTLYPFTSFPLRQMLAAGCVAGLLPLVHAHSLVVVMTMGACLALVQGARALTGEGEATADGATVGDWKKKLWAAWRPWVVFGVAASLVAVPQMWWATRGSAVEASKFFGWAFGWEHGAENVVWFWLKNTGVFIPLLLVALAWRGRGAIVPARLFYFYLPFTLCFLVPNVYKLSPWVWDNIKVLFYWWVASAPLVALVLARLWRKGAGWRAVALALLVAQTAAGGLDVWRAASGVVERQTFDPDGVLFAEMIRRETAPRSLILHAPTYNDPVYLTGRRTYLGYPGHLWSHGLEYREREAVLKRIYAGAPDAASLLAANGIEYVVVGPLEREEMRRLNARLDVTFFERYTKVGEAGEYRLYKTRP